MDNLSDVIGTEGAQALQALIKQAAVGASGPIATVVSLSTMAVAATAVLALDLVEVSAKVRSGAPVDEPQDCTLPHWAGVLPLCLTGGKPVPADDLDPTIAVPPYLTGYSR